MALDQSAKDPSSPTVIYVRARSSLMVGHIPVARATTLGGHAHLPQRSTHRATQREGPARGEAGAASRGRAPRRVRLDARPAGATARRAAEAPLAPPDGLAGGRRHLAPACHPASGDRCPHASDTRVSVEEARPRPALTVQHGSPRCTQLGWWERSAFPCRYTPSTKHEWPGAARPT